MQATFDKRITVSCNFGKIVISREMKFRRHFKIRKSRNMVKGKYFMLYLHTVIYIFITIQFVAC